MRKLSRARIAVALVPNCFRGRTRNRFHHCRFRGGLRAPTPSAAAELIVPAAVELDRRVNELAVCLQRCWRNFIA